MNVKILFMSLVLGLTACTGGKYSGIPEKYHALLDENIAKAGANVTELERALKEAPADQKEGMAFLIAYMPERDVKELKADFLLENVAYAYKTKTQFPWVKEIPEDVFLNDVLPYVSLNEKRENWRKDFYERFSKYVASCTTLEEAIDAVNKNVRDEVQVDYNTKREKPDQAPYESMRQHMASCSGLSILLTDAFRAVGIPSRVAGTPSWHDNRGNHNWTEVWLNGRWYFTEFYQPPHLDDTWFLADAGKATKDDVKKAIYASSFKPSDTYFPLVWGFDIRYVHAENVTDRYVSVYNAKHKALASDGNHVEVKVMVFKDRNHAKASDDRVATNMDVFMGKEQMGGGRSAGPKQDMNDVLSFLLEKNQTYTIKYVNGERQMQPYELKVGEKDMLIKLYMK